MPQTSSLIKIKVEDIVAHLSHEFRTALEQTVRDCPSGERVDPARLLQSFRQNLRLSCDEWELVPAETVCLDAEETPGTAEPAEPDRSTSTA